MLEYPPYFAMVDMGAEGARLMAASFGNTWIGMIRVMQLGARLLEEAYPNVLRVCEGADLVVTSDTGSGVAEADGVATAVSAIESLAASADRFRVHSWQGTSLGHE